MCIRDIELGASGPGPGMSINHEGGGRLADRTKGGELG
jgi:hypothetical protein